MDARAARTSSPMWWPGPNNKSNRHSTLTTTSVLAASLVEPVWWRSNDRKDRCQEELGGSPEGDRAASVLAIREVGAI